jgi:glycerophosphoryl diester phosphodiesterase
MDLQNPRDHYIYIAAHRGWLNKYPENTMEAFIAAEELGVDQIETDVRITKDGHLVLIHDAKVDRTTNGTGLVCEKTLAELQALDAGSYRGPEFAGCRIPTFMEFMDHLVKNPTITLGLELKEYVVEGWEDIAYSVCDRVLQIIDDYHFRERTVINTMDGKLHDYIREKYGDTYRQSVYYPLSRQGECKTCIMLPEQRGVGLRMASREAFDLMHSRGIQCWVGTGVKDEAGIDEFIERGGKLIICDNPDELLTILRKKGYHD